VAKEACDQGRIRINDLPAKASENVRVGDVVTVEYGHRIFKYRVLDVSEHVRKDEADSLYEIIN
jgi:ribosomal 50S subunit-recycling heat shock protein